ncbi:MAG: Maf family protein [Synergistetes bacterium]|nr:Maf family protein [Synergistota bacterium]MCX8127361.1 Maf family protein [Synergistota bacterium]MDW8192225.1 Maf family protein [Synergistota bacterium]
MKIVLASSSPRRQELLKMIGLDFEVISPIDVDESQYDSVDPKDIVVELAFKKAKSVSEKLLKEGENALVIGVDTLVEIKGLLLGKPSSKEEAFNMMQLLQGNTHRVFSGVGLIEVPTLRSEAGFEVTKVSFYPLTISEINAYIDSGEWVDKAGAYAIQGKASLFVKKIEGCYFNVVGLPLALLRRLLIKFGLDPLFMEV